MVGLITTDLHLNEKPRDQYRWDFINEQLPKLIKQHQVDWLAILGDLTDDFDHHSATLTNQIVKTFTQLARLCDLYVLRGNHDCVDPETPFFKFIGKFPNLRWVNRPTTINFREFGDNGWGNTLWLPHSRDPMKDWQDLDFKDVYMVFAHQTFTGAVGDSGSELVGVQPSDVIPKGIPILSGDVHVPQELGRVTYVGSPYKTTFTANEYSPRVILIDNDGNLKSIKVRGPQKQLVIAEKADDVTKQFSLFKGDIVKLRVKLTAEEALNWQAIKKGIEKEAANTGVSLYSVEALLDAPIKNKKHKLIDKVQSNEEILRIYIKQQGIDAAYLETGVAIVRSKQAGSK